MKALIYLAAAVALCTAPVTASSFLGHAAPDSLHLIEGDHTVEGTEFAGGISGAGVLTMTDADTLIIIGDADFSGVTLSDSAAGLIVFALPADSNEDASFTYTFGVSALNNIMFLGEGEGYESPEASLMGDTLVVNGNLIGDIMNRFTLGAEGRPMNLIVKGDMEVRTVLGRINAYGGRIVVHGDYVVPRIWWSYHGTRTTVVEFAGADTQLVEVSACSSKVKDSEYGKIVHSGEGVMRLIGRGMVCDTFVQTAGALDLNGFFLHADVLEFAGALENTEGWSCISRTMQVVDIVFEGDEPIYVYDTLFDTSWFDNQARIEVEQDARFIGTEEAPVSLSPARPWEIESQATIMAMHAVIGNSVVTPEHARAIAYSSTDDGENTGWMFRDGGSAFSLRLPDSAVAHAGDAFSPKVAAVLLPGDEHFTIEWTVDSATAGTGAELLYSDAVFREDSGAVFRAYLKNGDVAVDSVGPMTLHVLDHPRLENDISGREGQVGETMHLAVTAVAGADSIHWYRVYADGDEKEYVALDSAYGDTLTLAHVTKQYHGHIYAAIAFDTSAAQYPPDTVEDDIKVFYPVTIIAQPQDTAALVGDTISFFVRAFSAWDGALEYQWSMDEDDLSPAMYDGADSDTLTIYNVTADMLGAEFRVKIVGDGGKRYYSETATLAAEVGVARRGRAIPTSFSFAGIAPNPVRGTAFIRFALPRQSRVRLAVYSLDGREIICLKNGLCQAGFHRVPWEGITGAGRPAGQGHYIVRIEAGDKIRRQRFVLTR